MLLNQFRTREHMKFDTFDAALDEFYSKIESQRSEQQQKAKEDSAIQKLNKIRLDQVFFFYLLNMPFKKLEFFLVTLHTMYDCVHLYASFLSIVWCFLECFYI